MTGSDDFTETFINFVNFKSKSNEKAMKKELEQSEGNSRFQNQNEK